MEALALHRCGRQLEALGDRERAASVHAHAAVAARGIADAELEAQSFLASGFNYGRLGQSSERLLCYQKGLEAARKANNPELLARALNNLGVIYSDSDVALARDFLLAAAEIRNGLPEKHEAGETYASLAATVTAPDECSEYARRAVELLDPDRNRSAWASVYDILQQTLSEPAFKQLQEEHRDTLDRLGLISKGFRLVELSAGQAQQFGLLHDFAPILKDGNIGLILRRPEEPHRTADYPWQAAATKANVLWDMKEHSQAIDKNFSALAEIDRLRGKISADVNRQQFSRRTWDIYDRQVGYLVAENRLSEALEVAERAKTRQLAEIAEEAECLPRGISNELKETYLKTRRQIQQRTEELMDLRRTMQQPDADALAAAEGELTRLHVTLRQTVIQIRAQQPDFDPTLSVATLKIDDMRALLRGPGHAFIVYWLGNHVTGAFCLTERDLSFVRLPDDSESKAALDSLQGLYDRLPLMGMNELEAALRCMHGLWFAPLDEAVHSRRLNEITVIPHYRAHLISIPRLAGVIRLRS